MKKIFLSLMMLAGLAISTNAQTLGVSTGTQTSISTQTIGAADLPTGIRGSFSQQFNTAANPAWTRVGTGYNADFTVDGARHSVAYDANGRMTRHSQVIQQSALPTSVVSSWQSSYKTTPITGIEKIEESGAVSYRLRGNPNYDISYDANGKVMTRKQ